MCNCKAGCNCVGCESDGEFMLRIQMADEFLGDNYPNEKRNPIWTDKSGHEYWRWKDITDSHFSNILALKFRCGKEITDKWKRQASKRHITVPVKADVSVRELT